MALFILLGLSAVSYGEISATNKEALQQLRMKLNSGGQTPPAAAPSYAVKKERPAYKKPRPVIARPQAAPVSKPASVQAPASAPAVISAPVKNASAPAAAPVYEPAKTVSTIAAPAGQSAPATSVTPPGEKPQAKAVSQTVRNFPPVILDTGDCFDIVLDPGHGGRYEPSRSYSGDHWDPFSKTFLLPYNFGASAAGMYEHEWTLFTAKKIEEILNLTHTDAGFAEFCKILEKHADISKDKIKKVRVNTHLTRRYSWEDDPEKNMANVNKKYRLFDSPDSFGGASKNKPSEKMHPGRISFINQISPDLVVSLHNNSNPNRNVRGFSSVIVPHFDFFSSINGIVTNGMSNMPPNQMKVTVPKFQKVANFITSVISRAEKIDVKTIISDTATYFTGFRAFTHKFIGLRYLMVTWRYNTSSLFTSFTLFFMRENSVYEKYRRAGGPEGYGGDNFYSSEELIRYIRSSLWDDLKTTNGYYAAKTNAVDYAGPHSSPFVSDWAIPLHVNAVTAYLELGYLSNTKDRKLLKEKQQLIAESAAVGIYSLLVGLTPKKVEGVESPRGAAIDFAKYGRDKNSNGYFNISCRPLTF